MIVRRAKKFIQSANEYFKTIPHLPPQNRKKEKEEEKRKKQTFTHKFSSTVEWIVYTLFYVNSVGVLIEQKWKMGWQSSAEYESIDEKIYNIYMNGSDVFL